MIDAHAHLDFENFQEDLDKVLLRAWETGLSAIVTIGTDLATSKKAATIARSDPRIYAAAGIHPHDAGDAGEVDYQEIERLLDQPEVVALGEIGLDFFKEYSPRSEQEICFRRLLNLGQEKDMPIIIHCRDAHERMMEILEEERQGDYLGMFHCFSGDEQTARRVLDAGFDLSFTGTITYKNSEHVQKAVQITPIDRIHIETDCPFLAPVPKRGKRNEPSYVRHVLAKVAELKGLSLEETERRTEANTRHLFRLGS